MVMPELQPGTKVVVLKDALPTAIAVTALIVLIFLAQIGIAAGWISPGWRP